MPCILDVFTGILNFKVVALLQVLHYFGRLLLSPSELSSEEMSKANRKLFCKIILGMSLLFELLQKLFKTWQLLGTVFCLPPDKPVYEDASQCLLSTGMEYAFYTLLEWYKYSLNLFGSQITSFRYIASIIHTAFLGPTFCLFSLQNTYKALQNWILMTF